MRICPNCGNSCPDGAAFCNACGASLSGAAAQAQNQQPQQNAAYTPPQQTVYVDPTDHTSEFDASDISKNKILAMAAYLLGWVGVIIALLGGHDSPYAAFHAKEALKISLLNTLIGICTAFLFWTIIVPIAGGICIAILFVVKIICFFSVCSGKAKEAPIIKSLAFLK